MNTKSLQYVSNAGLSEDKFKSANGWIHRTLKCHDFLGINFHGQAGHMDKAEGLRIMNKWKEEQFCPLVEKYKVPPEHIYNADMVDNCFDIEDQQEIVNGICDDDAEIIENEKSSANDADGDNLEEDPMEIDDNDEVYCIFLEMKCVMKKIIQSGIKFYTAVNANVHAL